MKVNFIKMQVCGNDYLLFDGEKLTKNALQKHAKKLCDRRFGVGADGTVLLSFCKDVDGEMHMFNADGSEGKMCGSALCMAAAYFYERLSKTELIIRTQSGDKRVRVAAGERGYQAGCVLDGVSVQAQMGTAAFWVPERGVGATSRDGGLREVEVLGRRVEVCCVDVGKPHAVIVMFEKDLDVLSVGKALQTHPAFPGGVNVEFVRVVSRREISVRVFERGSGETLCCCTGACAAVVAAVLAGYCEMDTNVTVKLRGGDLTVNYHADGTVDLMGNVKTVYEGTLEI